MIFSNLSQMFDGIVQLPHGYCLQWNPSLLWTLVVSDSTIAFSYFSIPIALWYYARRRPDILHRWLLILFGAFVMACGLTHVFDVLNIWSPYYWSDAVARIFTAALSLVTGVVIWLVMPTILKVPSLRELELSNYKLREAAQYARSLIEANLDPLVTIDIEGKIMDVNEATVRITGVDRQQLIGSDFSTYFTEPEKARFGYQKVYEKGLVVDYPLCIRHSSGRISDVLYNATLYKNEAGNIAGVFAAARDNTERKRQAQLLQEKTDALQQSNTDLEQFAYSVSHDMRQPLRAISGHLQLLKKSLSDTLDAEELENLTFALDGAKRMDSMIVSLLEYSRVGRKTQPITPVSSQKIFEQALAFLEPAIETSGAVIMHEGVWPQILASSDELIRLFQNLIGNALKYQDHTHPPRIEVISQAIDETWQIIIRDNGIGINPKHLDRLFKFFSRLHSSTRFEGFGMGLALCRRIIEHHNGRIWVESDGEGHGSRFIFTIPL